MDGDRLPGVGVSFNIATNNPNTVASQTPNRLAGAVWLSVRQLMRLRDRGDMEEPMRCKRLPGRVLASVLAWGMAFAFTPGALADDADMPAPGPAPAPILVEAAPIADETTPAAVTACGAFANVLDGTSIYYSEFADSLEGSNYSDPAVDSSNGVGRLALRQGAGVAIKAANTPGLSPDIADPMRAWSLGATALLVKMGVRIPVEHLNNTATGMNENAEKVQMACARAGTHA